MNRRKRRHRRSGAGIYIAGILIALFVVAIFGTMFFLRKKEDVTPQTSSVEAPDYDNADKWSEGVISHNGQSYRYNKNIRTYLFLEIGRAHV